MEYYFAKFPTIEYDGKECVDITRRVKISDETKNALTLYYTYLVKNGRRPDLIAHAYYDIPSLDWLVYLTNEIVDPYYQWSLSDEDFNKHLIKKYGSIENSIKKIIYYRNNWYNDDQQLTNSHYENILDNTYKKYYEPVYGPKSDILAWKRREEDWTMETNKIYKLECANTSNFEIGELVDVTGSDTLRVGGGEITEISNTYIMIKNIDGEFVANDTVTGETSEMSETVSNTSLVYEAVTLDEGVFWSPVTFYDIEEEKNVRNRSIQILDNSHRMDAVEGIRQLLKE